MLLPNFPMKTLGEKYFGVPLNPVMDGDYNRTYYLNIIGSLIHKIYASPGVMTGKRLIIHLKSLQGILSSKVIGVNLYRWLFCLGGDLLGFTRCL